MRNGADFAVFINTGREWKPGGNPAPCIINVCTTRVRVRLRALVLLLRPRQQQRCLYMQYAPSSHSSWVRLLCLTRPRLMLNYIFGPYVQRTPSFRSVRYACCALQT
ncbi:unnamed protein product, partial [Pylaiella littoralis]